MNPINFVWSGNEQDKTGWARFTCGGKVLCNLRLPEFSMAHEICRSLAEVYNTGHKDGIDNAQTAMNKALGDIR